MLNIPLSAIYQIKKQCLQQNKGIKYKYLSCFAKFKTLSVAFQF